MERLPVGVVARMDCRDPRVEYFLHLPHMRIAGDLLSGDLLAFGLPLFLLVGGRRRRYVANLAAIPGLFI